MVLYIGVDGDTDRHTGPPDPVLTVSLSSWKPLLEVRRLEAEVDLRSCVNNSGLLRVNEACAYISVSGPRRTLANPYYGNERGV